MSLSPASIRNVMTDLEAIGLITSPHTSAGRLPTELGLRFFVDALLEIGNINEDERSQIEARVSGANRHRIDDVLTSATNMLSGLSQCAGVLMAPKINMRLKHIEFVKLDAERGLVILVGDDGTVENRIMALPPGLLPSSLVAASNYLGTRFIGKTLSEIQRSMKSEIQLLRREIDELTATVVEEGLVNWSSDAPESEKTLIVRGRANLIDDIDALQDLERVRSLLDDLETKKDLIRLLGMAEEGEGVRIFIGSENKLFSLSGSSIIIAPYRDAEERVVGVLGVIGPTRINYARIIPMVDYTAKMVSRLLS
ncbi:heat-inducible transcriptional repressor [Rhodoligotrophos appendicifer]